MRQFRIYISSRLDWYLSFNSERVSIEDLELLNHFAIAATCCADTIDSNGHACMLQYALLHLCGYKLSMDDLKAFRVSVF